MTRHQPESAAEGVRRRIERIISPGWAYQASLPFAEPPPEPEPAVMPEGEFFDRYDPANLLNRDNLKSPPSQRSAVIDILEGASREVLNFGWPNSGKTAVAANVVANFLARPGARALFLTQQRALCYQAEREMRRFMRLADGQIQLLTPAVRRTRRLQREEAPSSRLDIATAHSAHRDIDERRQKDGAVLPPALRLQDYAIVIIDEVHLARGKHAAAEIIRRIRELPAHERPFLLTLSGTPFAPGSKEKAGREEFELRELLGPQARIVPIATSRLEHDVRSRRLDFSPRVLELAQDLLAIIYSLQDMVYAGVSEWPDLAEKVAKFVGKSEGGIARTGSGKSEVELRNEVQATMPRTREREEVREGLLVLGRLTYLYQQLWSLGTFPLLDTYGRALAWATLPRFESSIRVRGAKENRTAYLSPLYLGDRDVWFTRLLHAPRMHNVKRRLDALYLRAALGTPYEAVLTATNLDTLAWNMAGIDPDEVCFAEKRKQAEPSPVFRTQRALHEATFDGARRRLAAKIDWHDHPKTDEILRVIREWALEPPFERVIHATSSAQHALFLSDVVAAQCQGVERRVDVPFAGRNHMPETQQLAFLECFRHGTARGLSATAALGYGHHIPDARILYILDPIDSAKARQQYEDRIDRDRTGRGFIVYLVMRGTSEEQRFFAGRNAQRRMVQELEKVRRGQKKW